jgi:hypothetical protein
MFRQTASIIVILLLYLTATADTGKNKSSVKKSSAAATQQRITTLSNNQFYVSENGVIGYDISRRSGGWWWPRGSKRVYVFGQGFWFGAKKMVDWTKRIVTSMSYDPDAGSTNYFVPGSVDDGLVSIDETILPVQKYYLYVSTDFSSSGKNLVSSRLADWPIRWTNPDRIPGRDGYFGDYTPEPASRFRYSPVVISAEDIFCIYKDTDVGKNPYYKPFTGAPLAIDVMQQIFTWGDGQHRNFVILVYTIVNKSGDTFYECFAGVASDPDIGMAVNDHGGFYTPEPSRQLAYVYSEQETGYPGIIGFDLFESPRVRTLEDSVLLSNQYQKTRHVGEQIGLTSFRAYQLYGPGSQYDSYNLMASGLLDTSSGPGDIRVVFASGPFTMLPGDTARFVVCQMIAPSAGKPFNGEEYDYSLFLEELLRMDSYAQECYSNERLSDLQNYAAMQRVRSAKK